MGVDTSSTFYNKAETVTTSENELLHLMKS